MKPRFAECIAEMDEGVSLLLIMLADPGLDMSTLAIFTSDNGGTPAPA